MIISYVIIFVRKNNEYTHYPFYNFSEIRSKLKTGDIILFKCQHDTPLYKLSYYVRTGLVGTEYGHSGIVIKGKNGNLFILECCGYDQCGYDKSYYMNGGKKGRGGVRIINLDTVLGAYKKEYNGYFGVKFIEKEIPLSTINRVIKKYRDVFFQYPHMLAILAITDNGFSHALAKYIAERCDKKHMICTEFTYDFLYECGIVSEYPAKLFWPHSFTNETFKNIQIVKYSDLYKFEFAK